MVAALAWGGGCGDDDGGSSARNEANGDSTGTQTAGQTTNGVGQATNAPAQTTNAPPAATNKAISVTGTYAYKKETMVLKQSGNAITGTVVVAGFVQDPANPVQLPVPVVGSVDALGIVELQELLHYPLNPAKDYVIEKVGSFADANTLVLNVLKGQAPHTQTWIRTK